MAPRIDFEKAFGDSLALYSDTWLSGGWNEPLQTKVEFSDMLATPNAGLWLPQVIENVVREPVEPMLIVPSLLDNVPYSPGLRFTFGAIGAGLIASDIAEGQAYPEFSLNVAPGTMTVDVGKSGVAIKITEEMRRYSQFELINLHLRQARRALDRHKEKKGMTFISGMGTTVFDNRKPTESVYGTCTGRSLTGAGNGSCRMEDLLKAYAFIMMSGYTPNTLLLHPLAWSMWMVDPLLQTLVKNGNGGSWFQPVNMPKPARPWDNANQGKLGLPGGYGQVIPGGNAAGEAATPVGQLDQNLRTAPRIPGYFPFPLNVIVSPFVPFDEETNTCDIMLFDSSNLGALVVDQDVTVDQWDDLSVDITKIKLKERYGFQIYDDGLPIAIMRNIPIVPNEIALPLHATISAAGSIDELDVTSPIVGL